MTKAKKVWHWPERLCEQCRKPYPPNHRRQRFCGRPCFGVWFGAVQRGRDMSALAQKRRAKALAQSRERIEREFGTLSDRELALIKLALRRGYLKGYRAATWASDREEAA